MIINRHNYEEYFLLYVDNELPADERKAVEAFVKENTDLASELDILKSSTLATSEQLVFEDKHLLHKYEKNISLDNCEEYFLLDVDNELDEAGKQNVERFVLQHPQLQAAYTQLHACKLPQETMICPGKEQLYKSEERKLVPMQWMRIAAAAMFIGMVGLLYTLIPPDNNQGGNNKSVAGTQRSTDNANETSIATNKQGPASQPIEIAKEEISDKTKQTLPIANAVAYQKPAVEVLPKADKRFNIRPMTNTKRQIVKDVPSINEDELLVASNQADTDNNEIAAKVKPRYASTLNPVAVAANEEETKTDIVKQAVYRELDTETDDTENSFLFGSTRINKNKLRGLLKKATNLFDKKAGGDEKEKPIQIASFEIKGK